MTPIKFIVVWVLLTLAARAQDPLPVIKSNVSAISIRIGEVLQKSA